MSGKTDEIDTDDVRVTPTWEVHEIREQDAEYVNPLPRRTNYGVNGFAVQGRRDMLHHYDALLADNARLREALEKAETLLERIWQCEIPVGQLMQAVTDWRNDRAALKQTTNATGGAE